MLKIDGVKNLKLGNEISAIDRLIYLMENSKIPRTEILYNLSLFLRRQDMSRILYFDEIYKKIVNLHGYIFEFGTRFGASTATLLNLRGYYEPFNYSRKIITFDTFEGFAGVSDEDKSSSDEFDWKVGDYGVPESYEDYLSEVLALHESFSPIPQIKKHEICKGDVTETLPKYLKDHPEALVAMAYFDMDLYAPTKSALLDLKPRLQRGTILAFDELCDDGFPGETIAALECLDLRNISMIRNPNMPTCAYCII
jgi:hypothetical protein